MKSARKFPKNLDPRTGFVFENIYGFPVLQTDRLHIVLLCKIEINRKLTTMFLATRETRTTKRILALRPYETYSIGGQKIVYKFDSLPTIVSLLAVADQRWKLDLDDVRQHCWSRSSLSKYLRANISCCSQDVWQKKLIDLNVNTVSPLINYPIIAVALCLGGQIFQQQNYEDVKLFKGMDIMGLGADWVQTESREMHPQILLWSKRPALWNNLLSILVLLRDVTIGNWTLWRRYNIKQTFKEFL